MGKFILLLLTVMFVVDKSHAQGEFTYPRNREFETWSVAGLEMEWNKKLNFQIEDQFRLKDNSREFDRFLKQVQVQFDPQSDAWFIKRIKLGFGVRYIGVNDNTGFIRGYRDYIRCHYDLYTRYEIGRFIYTNRLRYQSRNELGVVEVLGGYKARDLRIKNELKYNIKSWKLDPKVSLETFSHYQIGEISAVWYSPFTTIRWTIGMDYKINDNHKLYFKFRKERSTLYFNPDRTYILILEYRYRFRRNNDK